MKKIATLITLVLTLLINAVYAQKKVAVVTFYINKQIDVTEFGPLAYTAVNKLNDDPKFNLSPLLKSFHSQFFDSYAKNFPFQLLPEAEVTGNDAYKAYMPVGIAASGILQADKFITAIDGYKILLYNLAGHENEKNMLKIFNQCDGVMDVAVDFKLVKTGIGGMGIVRVSAKANIILYNKNGDRVFAVDEASKSRSVSPLAGGVPVMTPEKIMPMCESAMAELMNDLQKDLPKMVKKSEAKL